MKWKLLSLMLFFFSTNACNSRQREEALQKREAALNQKEQELSLKEKTLQLKEEDLLKRESHFNSTSNSDSTHLIDSGLIGAWDVKMTCTETTCAGSAVGDTKSEIWQLAYTNNSIIVKAMSNNQLVRVYTGFYTGNTIELVEDKSKAPLSEAAKMVVRLRIIDKTHLDGQREIIRGDCKIVYALQLEKESADK